MAPVAEDARSEDLFGLRGRVSLVTGAGRGIGRGCALALARVGSAVAVVDREGATAREVAGEIQASGGRALAVTADVREEADAVRMLAECIEGLGGLDVCVNNAGGLAGGPLTRFLEVEPTVLAEMLDLNLRAVFRCCQLQARSMIKRGVQGAIVNVSSLGGVRAVRGVHAYGAAKAGVINLTRTMAVELGPQGIRTNAIAPGTTLTGPVQETTGNRSLATITRANPMRRLAQPEDIANAVLFLASELARYVNGQCISVDGGFEASVGVIARADT